MIAGRKDGLGELLPVEDEPEECRGGNGGISAKAISKFFKFVCATGIMACAFAKWLGFLPGASVPEICIVWAVVYGLGAGTIDANIMLDKFAGRR